LAEYGGDRRRLRREDEQPSKVCRVAEPQRALQWNGTLLKGDVAEEVRKLKQEPGQDILIYGSAKLVNSLMAHNLIDVYRLMVHPIVLGAGNPLFEQGAALGPLKLTDSQSTSTGVVMLTYEPADEAP
jgi:dihydrofolate reductase